MVAVVIALGSSGMAALVTIFALEESRPGHLAFAAALGLLALATVAAAFR